MQVPASIDKLERVCECPSHCAMIRGQFLCAIEDEILLAAIYIT
jgi:hypothetical protein